MTSQFILFTVCLTFVACGTAAEVAALSDAGAAPDAVAVEDAAAPAPDAEPVDAGAVSQDAAPEPVDAGEVARDAAAPIDTSDPFPLDLGGRNGAPDTYKGLPLSLVDNGAPTVEAVRGAIGVVCVGMSNSNQECSHWISELAGPLGNEVNAQVRVVNCAVGGHAIERWIDPAFDDRLWDTCVNQRIPAAGLALDQVRVIWHKAADQFTTDGRAALPPYPDPTSDYFNFMANLDAFAARVQVELPSVVAVYSTSRSYGGFTNNAARGEPLSYEEGHALNTWLAANPSVDGIWHGWGPYIWAPPCATGTTNGSNLCYDRADYVDDGTHPSPSGRAKVTAMLHARLLQEAWYRP